jgi:hypothetical protein
MDNESYDDILNMLMDVADGTKRRGVFESKRWLRASNEYHMLLQHQHQQAR